MSNAKKDENREATKLAVDTNGDAARLLVDPVTDRLLLSVILVSSTTPVLNNGKIDENYEKTALASNGTIPKPLLIDNRNGLLFVDLLAE